MINCHFSSTTIAIKKHLDRQLRNFHIMETLEAEKRKCMECPFKKSFLAVTKKTRSRKYGTAKQNFGIHCNIFVFDAKFSKKNTYKKFICCLQLHQAKIWNTGYLKHLKHLKQLCISTFGGTVHTYFLYFLAVNGDQEFLQFMGDRNQNKDGIIEKAVQAKTNRVQLPPRVKLERFALENEDATDLTIHVNSKKETVYPGDKFTEDAFFTMLDQMPSSLVSFSSHGIQ